jgi:agmatine/peptidylarginine deiminase
MSTWQCLHQRHPDRARTAVDTFLRDTFAARRVLWLDHGHLEGDDTDAHIDTLARFAPHDAIVYQACDDPADRHFEPLACMAAELAAFRTGAGDPYALHPLPWPRAIFDAGRRLPASYANYLIINDAVLVPAYDDPADDAAAAVIAAAHPGREALSIPCRSLLWQNGSLHCMTMQLPAGTLGTSAA